MNKEIFKALLEKRFRHDDHGNFRIKGIVPVDMKSETSPCGKYLYLIDNDDVVFVFEKSDKGLKQLFELRNSSGNNVCFNPFHDAAALKKSIASFYRIGFCYLVITAE
jgi:hypothetical protein